jgi:Ca2+-binding RTX toxin-like protein
MADRRGTNGNDIINNNGNWKAIYGLTGNDRITGASFDEAIWGGDGRNGAVPGTNGVTDDDILDGLGGNDRLFGEMGNDRLYGGSGADYLDGGDGNDALYGGAGLDLLFGGAGNDVISGAGPNHFGAADSQGGEIDIMSGGSGNDEYIVDNSNDQVIELDGRGTDTAKSTVTFSLAGLLPSLATFQTENLILTGTANIDGTGNALDNTITGNDGKNELSGRAGNDALFGYAGDDRISGGTGNDLLYGDDGDDTLNGDDGDDFIYGILGADILNGGAGNDFLSGDGGNDTLIGGVGNDQLYDYGGSNLLFGGEGDDFLSTATGSNTLQGGNGNDTLEGGSGADVLDGGDGLDILKAMRGADTLVARIGDTISGGADGDTFQIAPTVGPGTVYITDFNNADGDLIDFTQLIPGQEFVFNTAGTPGAYGLRQSSTATSTILSVDATGDGNVDFDLDFLGADRIFTQADFKGVTVVNEPPQPRELAYANHTSRDGVTTRLITIFDNPENPNGVIDDRDLAQFNALVTSFQTGIASYSQPDNLRMIRYDDRNPQEFSIIDSEGYNFKLAMRDLAAGNALAYDELQIDFGLYSSGTYTLAVTQSSTEGPINNGITFTAGAGSPTSFNSIFFQVQTGFDANGYDSFLDVVYI